MPRTALLSTLLCLLMALASPGGAASCHPTFLGYGSARGSAEETRLTLLQRMGRRSDPCGLGAAFFRFELTVDHAARRSGGTLQIDSPLLGQLDYTLTARNPGRVRMDDIADYRAVFIMVLDAPFQVSGTPLTLFPDGARFVGSIWQSIEAWQEHGAMRSNVPYYSGDGGIWPEDGSGPIEHYWLSFQSGDSAALMPLPLPGGLGMGAAALLALGVLRVFRARNTA